MDLPVISEEARGMCICLLVTGHLSLVTAFRGVFVPTVLILGANAGIGRALAAEFASHRYGLILAGRDLEELQSLAADLNLRHDVNDCGVHCCRR